MNLEKLIVGYKVNLKEKYNGIDTPERCQNPEHFKNYPWPVEYCYNRFGLRDAEWPSEPQELAQAVWCVGDSFTVGVGQPYDHIWPQILSKTINLRTINVGKDGASNNWIANRAVDIIEHVQPRNMVIMWSYLHRRPNIRVLNGRPGAPALPNWKIWYDRIQQPGWPDCHSINDFHALPQELQTAVISVIGDEAYQQDLTQTQHFVRSTNEDDIEDFANSVALVERCRGNTCVTHSVVPNFCPAKWVETAMQVLGHRRHIPYTEKLDLARDGHHFDRVTAEWVVKQVVPLLEL